MQCTLHVLVKCDERLRDVLTYNPVTFRIYFQHVMVRRLFLSPSEYLCIWRQRHLVFGCGWLRTRHQYKGNRSIPCHVKQCILSFVSKCESLIKCIVSLQLIQVAAYILGVPVDLIRISEPTIVTTPNSAATSTSFTSEICSQVQNCMKRNLVNARHLQLYDFFLTFTPSCLSTIAHVVWISHSLCVGFLAWPCYKSLWICI